jgi:hypothetical protein
VIAFVLFIVLRTFVVQTFVIVSESMRETLLVGDMLVATAWLSERASPGRSDTSPDMRPCAGATSWCSIRTTSRT